MIHGEHLVEGVGVTAQEPRQFKTGAPFCMMHREKEYIHRLISAESNSGTVRFLGVEMVERPVLAAKSQMHNECYDLLAENDCVRVYK